MRISLVCQSLLLTRALEIFLKDYIVPYKKSDFVITDRKLDLKKPQFIISSEKGNLEVPFLKSSLMIELDKFYINNVKKEGSEEFQKKEIDFETLEVKIGHITEKFRQELVNTIKEYYEN